MGLARECAAGALLPRESLAVQAMVLHWAAVCDTGRRGTRSRDRLCRVQTGASEAIGAVAYAVGDEAEMTLWDVLWALFLWIWIAVGVSLFLVQFIPREPR